MQRKKAVKQIGLQADGSWVMAGNLYLSDQGIPVDIDNSQHVWIGDLFCWKQSKKLLSNAEHNVNVLRIVCNNSNR